MNGKSTLKFALGTFFFTLPCQVFPGPGGSWEGIWWGSFDSGLARFHVVLTLDRDAKGQPRGSFDNIDDGIYGEPLLDPRIDKGHGSARLSSGERLEFWAEGSHLKGFYIASRGSYQTPGQRYALTLSSGRDHSVPRLGPDGKSRTDYHYLPPLELSDGWVLGKPSSLGRGKEALESGIRKVLDGTFPHIHSLTVVRGGRLFLDEYFYGYGPQETHPVQSITKSIFSILFGIAVDQGLLAPEEKLYDSFPEYRSRSGWDPRKEGITLSNLLTMTSGLGCDDWKDPRSCSWGMVASQDWGHYVLDLPLSTEPGKKFAYCGACLAPLSGLLEKRAGMSLASFANKDLFGPLGIQDLHWMKGPRGETPLAFGLELRPRDLAKIGWLLLEKGRWKWTRIVSRKWLEESLGVHVPREKFKGKADYGYLWWSRDLDVASRKCHVIYAWGVGGQFLLMAPELDLVCVVTGGNYKDAKLGANSLKLIQDHVLPAFLK